MAITPDSKSWTWVLERPCPECGFDARTFPLEDVGATIRTNAQAWQDILAGPGVATRPSDDVWSPLEYACHVRDVFRIFNERLDLMLATDSPLFANWDQDETAATDRYGEQDPAFVAHQLSANAEALAASFDEVSGEEWQRIGDRSDGTRFTVESFARYLIHDPVHHLHDVEIMGPRTA